MAFASRAAEWIYTNVSRRRRLRPLVNALLLRLTPKTARVGDAELFLNPADPVVSSAIAFGVYENDEIDFFVKHLSGCEVFVDVGANIGLYSALALHILPPSATIIALEPHPTSFQWLTRNIEWNSARCKAAAPKTLLLQNAAAARPGTYELHLNPDNSGDNRLYRGTFHGKVTDWPSIAVPGVTLDDVFEAHGIPEAHFVKLDVQGFEHCVVQGFQKTLAASPRVILMTEFWPKGLQEAGGSPREYLALLRSLGFELYELRASVRGISDLRIVHEDEHLIRRLPGRKYANLVCIKRGAPLQLPVASL